jgi:GAF domain-containing protein
MTAITIRHSRRFANDTTGRLEIPLEIRQQLGITIQHSRRFANAQSLNLEVVNGCIILQPIGQAPQVRRQGTALVVETSPLGNLDSLVDDLREEYKK